MTHGTLFLIMGLVLNSIVWGYGLYLSQLGFLSWLCVVAWCGFTFTLTGFYVEIMEKKK